MNNIHQLKRYELYPYLIKKHHLCLGVEVGVREGYHAKNLLENTDMFLYGIDIKEDERAVQTFAQYQHKSVYIIEDSNTAVNRFEDYSFDFIHIDADHHYLSVKTDLNIWYPKLKIGGVFSGDDYQSLWSIAEGTFGIVDAVEEFILGKNVELNVSGLGVTPKSERLRYAREIGYKTECNLIIGMSKYYYVEPRLLENRIEYDNVDVPQWWFIKGE